jgi:hypothetical protein
LGQQLSGPSSKQKSCQQDKLINDNEYYLRDL